MFKQRPWTDFQLAPSEIFSEACEIFSNYLLSKGFTYHRSKKVLEKPSSSHDFIFQITLGTRRGNSKGVSVNFNTQCFVLSKSLEEFKMKEGIVDGSNQLTFFQIGNLSKHKKYISWNLLKTPPKKIAKLHEDYAFPAFEKLQSPEQTIKELLAKRLIPEFTYPIQALDYILCFGQKDQAQHWIQKLVKEEDWGQQLLSFITSIKSYQEIDPKKKNLVYVLAKNAVRYGIEIK